MNRDDPNLRLATYGTLAPGRSNAHMLAKIDGQWSVGTVRGHLVEKGWGAALGFPGIILDAFEGDGYRRVPVAVNAGDDQVTASIYVLAEG